MTNRHEPMTEQEFLAAFHNATPETQADVIKLLNGEMTVEEAAEKYNFTPPASEPA